jgi:hypothetical protein
MGRGCWWSTAANTQSDCDYSVGAAHVFENDWAADAGEATAAQISVGVAITQSAPAIVSLRESSRLTQCVAGPLKRSLIEPLLNPTEPETVPKPV